MYIDSKEALLGFIDRAQKSSVLAVDTEFLREKTYFAKLCLLQLGTETEVAIVDPFAVKDLTVLADLFLNESVVKLFHAASQDLEILYREVGVMPYPVFDTQVAATLLGYTQQVGYASLVHSECGVVLKKAESYTDWSRRPLSPGQVQYAADDVIYLPKIYRNMVHALKRTGRLEWLKDDFEELSNPERYMFPSRERFLRLKRNNCLSRRQLSGARELAAWREDRARQRNVPRKWVLTDEQIVEICRKECRTLDDLFSIRGVRDRLNVRDARTAASLLCKGFDLPESEWPDLPRPNRNEKNVDAQVDLMMALAHVRAKENGIAAQTMASHDELVSLARGHREDIELLKGWRRQMLGNELIDLLEGRLALSLNGATMVVTPIEAAE